MLSVFSSSSRCLERSLYGGEEVVIRHEPTVNCFQSLLGKNWVLNSTLDDKEGFRGRVKQQMERQRSTRRKENCERVLNFWILPMDIPGELQNCIYDVNRGLIGTL